MTYKIIRAALLGIFIGIAGALTVTLGAFIKKLYEVGRPAIEASEVLSSINGTEGNLQTSIIRFHVKANSDSEADIALKYEVRDEILKMMGGRLNGCDTLEECESVINDNLSAIEETAKNKVLEGGYDYDVKAYIAYDTFPMRQYGELVLPAGEYKALRVDIGEAEGENFWCLLYPAVCYTSDCGAVISNSDGEKLERALDKSEFERLFVKKEIPKKNIKVKFKIFEMIKGFF